MPYDLLPCTFFTLKDGAKLRYARFEPAGKPRGTALIVPGRREFIEKKYIEVGQPLCDAGWRVVIVEPRGHGLSTRFLSGSMRQRDHADDFNVHLDDLRAFFAAIVAPDMTVPLILHGHSLGGHFILRWLAEDHPPAQSAFLTSPMPALGTPAHMVAHGVVWASAKLLGHATEYAPMQHDFGAEDCLFANNVLTQDSERFAIIENYFTAHPDMAIGGVTWGWMLASINSAHVTHARHYLEQIKIPVLALVGADDKVTPAKDILSYLGHASGIQTHVIAGSRHDILNETAAVRAEAWQKINAFLGI